MKHRGSRRTWLALAALAVLLRLTAWNSAVQMANDGPDFLWQARQFLEGRADAALAHPYHPLYAALTAAVAAPLGWMRPADSVQDRPAPPAARAISRPTDDDLARAAIAVSIAAGLACVFAAVALTRRIVPEQPLAALAAGVLVAVHGRAVVHASDIQGDTLHAAAVCWAVVALVHAADVRRTLACSLAAGLLTGLAYLARPEALVLMVAAAALALVALRAGAFRRATTGLAVYLLGAALLVAPYALSISELSGEFVLSLKPVARTAAVAPPKGQVFLPAGAPMGSSLIRRLPEQASGTNTSPPAPGHDEDSAGSGDETGRAASPELPLPSPALPSPSQAPRRAESLPGRVPAALGQALSVLKGTLRVDVAALVLAGLFLLRRPWPSAARVVLAVVGLWLALLTLHLTRNSYLSHRHLLVPVILLVPLAAVTMARLADWRGSPRVRTALRIALALLLAVHLASGQRVRHGDSEARLAALQWARDNGEPHQPLVVQRRKDGWYARRPVIVLQLPSPRENLLATMRREDAWLLVHEAGHLQRHRPDWWQDGSFREVHRVTIDGNTALVLQRN